jgi:hypothetical protein
MLVLFQSVSKLRVRNLGPELSYILVWLGFCCRLGRTSCFWVTSHRHCFFKLLNRASTWLWTHLFHALRRSLRYLWRVVLGLVLVLLVDLTLTVAKARLASYRVILVLLHRHYRTRRLGLPKLLIGARIFVLTVHIKFNFLKL